MKKSLLSFITLLFVVYSSAQQTSGKPRPVPDCGAEIPAIIFQNPVSQTVCPNNNATFTSSAYSSGRHWEMSIDNGVSWGSVPVDSYLSPFNFSIYQPDTLIVFSVGSGMNGYLFRCSYDGFCRGGRSTASVALIIAAINPQISSQPENTSVCKSFTADFTVSATGSSPNYQWQQSINAGNTFTDIPGKTNSKLTLDSVTLAMNNYQYRCVVSSPCASSVISSPAVLTVRNEATSIVTQPVSQNLCSSDTATLTVVAQGNNLTYQWQDYYNADIAGATNAMVKIPYVGGYSSYRCKISSTCATIYSNTATLNYTIVPALLPAEVRYVCIGQQMYISAINNYYESLPTLQWQVSTDSGITYTNIPNENSNFLAITGSASVNGNRYRCIINHSCFNGYSNIFTVYKTYIPAAVTLQPLNKTVCAGADVMFSTDATGEISFSGYQWQVSTNNGLNFSDINNAIGYDLALPSVTVSMDNYQYRCKISGCSDTTYSNSAMLKVFPSPSLGSDTTVTVNCDTCTTDIESLYNTSGFANTYWNTTHPLSVRTGKYYVKVSNTAGCTDSSFVDVNVAEADTIRTCKTATINIPSTIAGATYQWEWDSYGYFSEIPELISPLYNQAITGTHSPLLTLRNMDIAGRVIRCRVDGNLFTHNVYIKKTAYWNGSVDSTWSNPLNWSCGQVPDSQTEVIIPENITRRPFVNVNAACKKLFIRKNTQLIIVPGSNFNIGSN